MSDMSDIDEFGCYNARQYFDFDGEQEESNDDSYFDTSATSPKMRRSLSLHDLPTDNQLLHAIEELGLSDLESPGSAHALNLTKRYFSKERLDQLAQPKTLASSDKGRFTSLAEAVNKFQANTPQRFRSMSSQIVHKIGTSRPLGGTIANSPKLTTATRVRPLSAAAISREQKEQMEFEEAKRFKIRAHPVNKKILKGPMKPVMDKRPPTAIEPFNLTEIKKKDKVEEVKVATFKAQPLPKFLQKPVKTAEMVQAPTVSKSAKSRQLIRSASKQEEVEKKAERPSKLTTTRPKPFSFEERDLRLIKKKEELINKVFEEERKAREFRAQPPPKSILRNRNCSSERTSTTSKRSKGSLEELDTVFKARPATVLQKKPFEPTRDQTHAVIVETFNFQTDQRIEARHKFEQQLREKEELYAELRRQQEEIQKKKAEEEVANLRKLAEHKAQPIRKYKEVKVQPANKVTQPISPVFHTDLIRNKENII